MTGFGGFGGLLLQSVVAGNVIGGFFKSMGSFRLK